MNAAVIEVLEKAGSQDPNVLKPAEAMLKEWEIQRGFYPALYNVFSNHSLGVNVRWMAVLCFKNGVDRYWRKNAPNGIAEDEKAFLRQGLIASLEEPVSQIATHLAVVIGKIARLDWPRDWDNLIPTLLEVIHGPNKLANHRALLTLYHVVKTLSSKRLAGDIERFEKLAESMFDININLWNTYTESFLMLDPNRLDETQMQESLEMAVLLLRILKRLFKAVSPMTIASSQNYILFFKVIFARAKSYLECRKTLICRGIQVDLLEQFIIKLIKILIGVIERHAMCHAELISESLELSFFYCFTEEGKPFTFEKFTIQCLYLMKSILIKSKYYERIRRQSDQHDSLNFSAEVTKMDIKFFTEEMVKEICTKLVTHYFLMTQADLEVWESDPEGFAVEDGKELWKSNLRMCTETLFLTIFPQFLNVMRSVLIDLIKRFFIPVDPNDCNAILIKDAVYLAVGLVADDLYDEVDFDQWFSTTLKQELEIENNNYKIIKRRVCWLIGKWTRVKLRNKLKPELYKMMIKALSPEEDLVVRLEASNTLKQAIDDFQFDVDEFTPFLETTVAMLFNLLREVTECDTKMHVLYVLSFVIERVGNNIRPFIGPFSGYLPTLWQISEEHNMLRCAIISTLVHYVKALRSETSTIEPLIVSMVSLSCDLNQDSHVYLMEDGLELWLALVENSSVPTPRMVDILQNMPAILDSGLDQITLKPAICIIQAYVLLCPQDFLEIGTRIILGIKAFMSDLNANEILPVLELFELILRVAPEQGTQLVKPVLGKIFINIYMDEYRESLLIKTKGLTIVARVLLTSRDVFAQIVGEVAQEIGRDETEETVMGRMIEVWLQHMSNVSQPEWMKILGLALCSLLNSNSPPVVCRHFKTIITTIDEVLNDISVLGADGWIDSLLLVNWQNSLDEEVSEYETEHQRRMKRLEFEDPVHTACLKNLFKNQLNTLRRLIATDEFDQMIATLPDVKLLLTENISF